jgi:hypothetical protein
MVNGLSGLNGLSEGIKASKVARCCEVASMKETI